MPCSFCFSQSLIVQVLPLGADLEVLRVDACAVVAKVSVYEVAKDLGFNPIQTRI